MGWLAFASASVAIATSGIAMASENLPTLRVDPALLGGAPLKPPRQAVPPAQQPPAQAATPGPTAEKAETTKADSQTGQSEGQATVADETKPVATGGSQVEVNRVTPPPAARDLPVAAAARPQETPVASAQAADPPKPVSLTPPATAATASVLAATPAARTAAMGPQNLPSLRVDPGLLGPAAPAPQLAELPPEVAERAPLAPLYSAHVAAGVIAGFPPRSDPPIDKKTAPTQVTARNISGINEIEVIAAGDAELKRADDTLRAERIIYRQAEDEVEAIGDVRLTNPDAIITGPRLRMRMADSTGEFESPAYIIKSKPKEIPEPALTMSGLPAVGPKGKVFATTGKMLSSPPVTASGSADRLEFRGEDLYHLKKASYSTCAPNERDWELVVDELDLDYTTATGEARHATVRFKDVPLLYTPWISFPLNNERKSGLLTPTIGSTSKSGFEVTAPWYWNIAPNMDATIAPRLMSRRGMQLNTEFRYLDYNYRGQARVEYLPDDKLANRDRYGYALIHNQNLGHGFSTAINLNGVSDDDYFGDLSTRVAAVSQGNLLRQGILSYGGPWYSAALNVQTYQTLADLPSPYRRLPQLTGTANRYDLPLGMAFNVNAEYVNFDHPTELLGKRTTLYPQLSLPLATAAFWLTPKVGFHSTHYQLSGQERLAVGDYRKNVPNQQDRAVPIFSVDGGFVMERDTDWFGRSLLQTLEPRAYYLYVPTRDQSRIPLFDTGIASFNHAQMFAENRYAGGDRIANANQLTLAVTSRLLDPTTGAEMLRATLGQLHYFTLQDVTLPGETARTSRSADILAALSGQVLPKTYADFGWQYNPRDKLTERLTVGGRYHPAPGKIFNAGYRYSRDLLGQIDVSAQWPLGGGWNAVGRYNYSTKESRVIETIGGIEYNAGCWVGRFVVQRLATIADRPTTATFFQLELNDFSRIGSNPLELLRRNIPGYGVINQPTADPVFASH
ncbi:MAG: LPS assembly protein LptD [Rhodocyclaceae bacterium]|nr:LPS assembly protein LptD [Rhodocyclaceae bacterium]